MPEGDTLFRAARALTKALAGQQVSTLSSVLSKISAPLVGEAWTGVTVTGAESRGKHCLIHFSNGRVLRTHLRMNGSWHLYRPGEPWRRSRDRARIVIETPAFVAVAFDVYDAEWVGADALPRHRGLQRLGPDLLRPDFDAEEVLRRMRAHPELTLADAVLRQDLMAGAGNVFKSEVLFLSRLHPFLRVAEVSDEALREVIAHARRHLKLNVKDGAVGITTWYGLRRTTGRSDPAERLWVYGRVGQPCRRCGTPIVLERRGDQARSTYLCPTCQPGRTSSTVSTPSAPSNR